MIVDSDKGLITVPDVVTGTDGEGAAALKCFFNQDGDLDAAVVDRSFADAINDTGRYDSSRDTELLA